MMDGKSTETGADRLKKFRKSLGLTQEQMAEELGISESLYKGVETKRIPISRKTAEIIEHKFDVSADYFYYGTLRDGEDAWTQVVECNDADKFKIFLKLLNYFSDLGYFQVKDEDIDNIVDSINSKQEDTEGGKVE